MELVSFSQTKIDSNKFKDIFNNEMVNLNLISLLEDFEFMHQTVQFNAETPDDNKRVKENMFASFICGVISSTSKSSSFQKNLVMPKECEQAEKDRIERFANSLSI